MRSCSPSSRPTGHRDQSWLCGTNRAILWMFSPQPPTRPGAAPRAGERANRANQSDAADDEQRGTATALSAGHRLDYRCGAVGDDLAHRLSDLRRVEAHHDDRVGSHHGGIFRQAIDRLAPRLLEKVGVVVDLPTDGRAQSSHDVPAEPAAADDDATVP